MIFESQLPNTSTFKFVQIKMTEFKKESEDGQPEQIQTLLQIIDVSHEILFNEVKAEKECLKLINVAVSHDLRNPLSSMIS